jgi:hypothetical protein
MTLEIIEFIPAIIIVGTTLVICSSHFAGRYALGYARGKRDAWDEAGYDLAELRGDLRSALRLATAQERSEALLVLNEQLEREIKLLQDLHDSNPIKRDIWFKEVG